MTAGKPTLECFFDCSSPWTYLAFTGVQPMAERLNVAIEWRPILVGGVFNAVNQGVYAAREALFQDSRRLEYYMKDLQDWARHYGLRIGWPTMHPANSAKVMRGCLVAEEQGLLLPYAQKVFETYWGEERDIGDEQVIRDIVQACGLDGDDFFDKVSSQAYKDRLRANGDELIERGGFGSPTFFVNREDMYFGNDRLTLVEAAIKRDAS